MKTDAVWHQALVLWRSRQLRFVVVGLWNSEIEGDLKSEAQHQLFKRFD